MQLNYSTNVQLLIPRFMKSLCVITIKLNTLTDVPHQIPWVGHLFTYVKTRERGRVKDFEQRSHNGFAVYKLSKFKMACNKKNTHVDHSLYYPLVNILMWLVITQLNIIQSLTEIYNSRYPLHIHKIWTAINKTSAWA